MRPWHPGQQPRAVFLSARPWGRLSGTRKGSRWFTNTKPSGGSEEWEEQPAGTAHAENQTREGDSTDAEERHGLIKKVYLDGGRSHRQQGIIHKIGQPLQDHMPTEDKNTLIVHSGIPKLREDARSLGPRIPALAPSIPPVFPTFPPPTPPARLQHSPAQTPVHSFHPSISPPVQHSNSLMATSHPHSPHSPLTFSIPFWPPNLSSMPTFQPFKPESFHPLRPAHALGEGSRARPFGKLRV